MEGLNLKKTNHDVSISCSYTVLSYWFYFGCAECEGFWFPKVIQNALLTVCKFPVCFNFHTIKSPVVSEVTDFKHTEEIKIGKSFSPFFLVTGNIFNRVCVFFFF